MVLTKLINHEIQKRVLQSVCRNHLWLLQKVGWWPLSNLEKDEKEDEDELEGISTMHSSSSSKALFFDAVALVLWEMWVSVAVDMCGSKIVWNKDEIFPFETPYEPRNLRKTLREKRDRIVEAGADANAFFIYQGNKKCTTTSYRLLFGEDLRISPSSSRRNMPSFHSDRILWVRKALIVKAWFSKCTDRYYSSACESRPSRSLFDFPLRNP